MTKHIARGHTHRREQLGIQTGVTDVFRVEGSAYVDHSVQFPQRYPVIPTVVAGMYSTSEDPQIGGVTVALMAANEAGFTVRVFNSLSSARLPQVGWIAVGFPRPMRPDAQRVMILDSGRLDEAVLA